MPFTQEKKANVCHGCNEHCALGHTYDINDEKAGVIRFYPTIGGKRITEYIGAEGDTVKIDQTCIKAYRDSPYYIATSIQLAREIAKQCDHYKKR